MNIWLRKHMKKWLWYKLIRTIVLWPHQFIFLPSYFYMDIYIAGAKWVNRYYSKPIWEANPHAFIIYKKTISYKMYTFNFNSSSSSHFSIMTSFFFRSGICKTNWHKAMFYTINKTYIYIVSNYWCFNPHELMIKSATMHLGITFWHYDSHEKDFKKGLIEKSSSGRITMWH